MSDAYRRWFRLLPVGMLLLGAGGGTLGFAQAPAPTEPTLEQRVRDLEQYHQNLAVGGSGSDTWASKIAGVPGPGHNAWLMTSAALVLFMTLPGLALFYGGLVRKKNVLSVLAQCLGCAGLVTVLWWAVG